MNTSTTIALLTVSIAGLGASSTLGQQFRTNEFTITPNVQLADANPIGWRGEISVSGLAGTISSVAVLLNISGGCNADLYAYLAGPDGVRAILINRPGITGSNPFGYSDAGLNLTLDSSAPVNVHNYGLSYSLNANGQVTGTYAADGRNIDPDSDGADFDSAPIDAGLNLFDNRDSSEINGVWTLLFADTAGGAQFTINSVTMQIKSVPEPAAALLLAGGAAALLWLHRRRNL